MGIDSMRVGGGRCPPLIVGGLILACLILVCNWWTLSSENLELLRQIDDLSEQLKMSAEDRDKCFTQQGNLEQRYKRTQGDLANANIKIEQLDGLRKEKLDLEDSFTACRGTLDSLKKLDATKNATLETLRLDKDTLNTKLDQTKEENEKQKKELNRIKDELEKLKLTLNSPGDKKVPDLAAVAPISGGSLSKGQLKPILESEVNVSVSGQRGLKFHGTPILPQDPPGTAPQRPRLSVTMLKAAAGDTKLDNGMLNDVNQEIQNKEDSQRANDRIDEVNNAEETDNAEEARVQESERDVLMNNAAEPDKKEDTNK